MQQQQPSIETLLSDKDLRVEFIFYVNKIHAEESLLFWMEVEIYKRITDSEECHKQAKLLYHRYLHPNSNSEINVEGKLKTQLENTIAKGQWDQTLFNHIQESVQECLKYSVVKSFLEFIAKRKATTEATTSAPAHSVLERYDDMVINKKEYGIFSKNPLRWLYFRNKKSDKKDKAEKLTLLPKSPSTSFQSVRTNRKSIYPLARKDKIDDNMNMHFEHPELSPRLSIIATPRPILEAKVVLEPIDLKPAPVVEPMDTTTTTSSSNPTTSTPTPVSSAASTSSPDLNGEDPTNASVRLSQRVLQQQIQILRNLRQYQLQPRMTPSKEPEPFPDQPWEMLGTSPTSLLKCASLPVIAASQ